MWSVSSSNQNKKKSKEDPDTCDMCFKLLQNEDRINPTIHLVWKENRKCRVYTNLYRNYADYIIRHESIKGKVGEILNETINSHLNSLIA